ncbi:MAG: 3-isopropylmalate dehydratase, partial [Omnitrophica WOR_2 bacterium SM23_29]
IECDTDRISAGDELEIDLEAGVVRDIAKKFELKFAALPKAITRILQDGGLVEHIKKHGTFKID